MSVAAACPCFTASHTFKWARLTSPPTLGASPARAEPSSVPARIRHPYFPAGQSATGASASGRLPREGSFVAGSGRLFQRPATGSWIYAVAFPRSSRKTRSRCGGYKLTV